jgi:hypothetical protein
MMIGCALATIVGRCVAFAETTKFYWPGRWSEKALRNHLKTDDKHCFTTTDLEELTFQDCLDLHDWHHCQLGMASKTPYPNGKHIPDSEPGRGVTTRPEEITWDQFLKLKREARTSRTVAG